MLDFCAEHGIASDIEMIAMQDIEKAYERMLEKRREIPLRHRHGVAEGGVRAAPLMPGHGSAKDRPIVGSVHAPVGGLGEWLRSPLLGQARAFEAVSH